MNVYTKEISGNECIGNSLSTINANFNALDVNLKNLLDDVNADRMQIIPFATTTGAGIVKIGQGLTITSDGTLNSNTQYTFTNGLLSSAGNVVSINVDNDTVKIDDEGYLTANPTPQDAWVISNSSSLMDVINNTSTQITQVSNTSNNTSIAIQSLSSEYNNNMKVTLQTVNSLVNLLSAKIHIQPVGGVANVPNPYILTISATPTSIDFLPLTYKWYFNSQLQSTNSRVLSAYNEGRYYCICTNAISQTRSNEVNVRFNQPVGFLDQPDSQQYQGTDIMLQIAVSGTHPVVYQWFRDDQPILNTNNLFYITNVLGTYHCVASNMVNSVTSDKATII